MPLVIEYFLIVSLHVLTCISPPISQGCDVLLSLGVPASLSPVSAERSIWLPSPRHISIISSAYTLGQTACFICQGMMRWLTVGLGIYAKLEAICTVHCKKGRINLQDTLYKRLERMGWRSAGRKTGMKRLIKNLRNHILRIFSHSVPCIYQPQCWVGSYLTTCRFWRRIRACVLLIPAFQG